MDNKEEVRENFKGKKRESQFEPENTEVNDITSPISEVSFTSQKPKLF